MNSPAMMQKLAEVAPDHYNFIIKTAAEVRSSPFRDEIVAELDSSMEKAAGIVSGIGGALGGPIPRTIGRSLAIGVPAMIIGGVAATLAGDMYDSIRRGLTKTRNYKKMLANNEDLSGTDPSVKANFETLHRFNPEYSADPNVAGGYVRHAKQFPSDIGMVHGLVSSRKAIRDSRALRPLTVPIDRPIDEELRGVELDKSKAQANAARAQAASNRAQAANAPTQGQLWEEQRQRAVVDKSRKYPQLTKPTR